MEFIWTPSNVLKFIESYRRKEILWNLKHPEHLNKSLKNNSWAELADEFNTTPEECKRKLDSLLSSLRRERSKIRKARQAKGEVYQSCWYAFKSLVFLWGKDGIHESLEELDAINNIIENTEEIENIDSKTSVDHIFASQPADATTTSFPQPSSSSVPSELMTVKYIPRLKIKKRKRLHHDSIKARKETSVQPIHSTTSSTGEIGNNENDECHIFGNLVAKKMQKYSPQTLSAVQQAIMNTLFNADRGFYDQNIAVMSQPSNHHNTIIHQTQPLYATAVTSSQGTPCVLMHTNATNNVRSETPITLDFKIEDGQIQ